jgi:hypothetical protein
MAFQPLRGRKTRSTLSLTWNGGSALIVCSSQVPDVLPCMSDTRWLQGQHLLVTLRNKGGQASFILVTRTLWSFADFVRFCNQFLGHSDISLSDAYNNMAYPVTADSMNLVTVLDHPVLSLMWDAHVQKEMSGENTAFYRAARAFQSWAVLSPLLFAFCCLKLSSRRDCFPN